MTRRSLTPFGRSVWIAVVSIALAWSASSAASSGWPGLRGPQHDGSAGTARLFPGESGALSVGWKRELGSGYSGTVVGDGRVIAMFSTADGDVVAAFDADSGEEQWRYRIGDRYAGHDGSHDGPISTPLIDGGRVYGLGPWGHLFALDGTTGAEIWSTNVAEDLGGKRPYFGFTTSPLMQDGVLVVEIGAGEGKAIAGFDPDDGAVRWSVGDDEIHYHSPVVATIAGQAQVLAAGSKTMLGIDAASGDVLWSYDHGGDDRAMGGATIVPVPAGDDRVFLMNKIDSSSMVEIARDSSGSWSVEELWSNNAVKSSYVVPVVHDGYLYGMNNRIFTCVDAQTGDLKWRSREPGDGFPTLVGDHLVVITKPGTVHVVEATPAEYREIASLELFEDHAWAAVAVADGKLYARSMSELARIDPTGVGATAGSTDDWLGATAFGAFLSELETVADKTAAVDAYLERQSSFPIVEDTGVVHFVWRGEADDVGIVGDMIGFRREDPMTRVPGTDLYHYSMRLEPDAAVTYGFIPAFGEEPIADPRNERAAEGLFGEVSWFAMPARDEPDYVAEAAADHRGRLETVTWTSEVREGQERTVQVYLPAGYDANPDRRYPVVYVHDGKSALEEGSLKRALDNLIGRSVRPLIAVFVHVDEENERGDLQDTEGYGAMIAGELVPKIDNDYRTVAEPSGRANVGAASAGNAAFEITLAHPDVFGRVGIHAPILRAGTLRERLPDASEQPLVLYVDWGTYHLRSPHEAWDYVEESRGLWALLRERGYRPAGGERPDGVGWPIWSARTGAMFGALFPN